MAGRGRCPGMEAESHDLDAQAATELPAETEAEGRVDVGVHLHAAGVARKVPGEWDGSRALVDVLPLTRHLTADAVALEALKAARAEDEHPSGRPSRRFADSRRQPTHPCMSGGWPTFRRTPDLCRRCPDDQLLRSRLTSGSHGREGEAQWPCPASEA